MLAEADRLALLYNWLKAAPLYAQAETLFQKSGDARNALYARLGYVWTTADTGTTAAVKDEVDRDFLDPMVRTEARLMLRCLVAKAALPTGLPVAWLDPLQSLSCAAGCGAREVAART